MKMHFQNGFVNLRHFDYLKVLSWIDQDFNIFESLIKFLQVLEMKMKMEMDQNEFDSFRVTRVFENFEGFRDFKIED